MGSIYVRLLEIYSNVFVPKLEKYVDFKLNLLQKQKNVQLF